MFDATEIYEYTPPGATGPIYADPLAVRRNLLLATQGRCWEWAKEARQLQEALAGCTGESEEAQATRAELSWRLARIEGDLASAAYPAFGLDRIDPDTGAGSTEATALEILRAFLGWLEGKGAGPSGWPTS